MHGSAAPSDLGDTAEPGKKNRENGHPDAGESGGCRSRERGETELRR